MADYDNTNSGAVFVNDRKTSDRHPDRTGSCEMSCPECGAVTSFWVSGWLKISKAGKRYMSLAFTKKEDMPIVSNEPVDDEDIPF